jgi:hypothetical protein
MAHEFVLLINGELKTYTEYEDIPEDFDNVIKFLPDVPHDHDSPDIWSPRLQELIKREKNARSM